MPRIDPIRTKRLLIREFQPSDREALLAIVRDPDQMILQQHFPYIRQQLAQVAGEVGGLRAVVGAMVVGKREGQQQARHDLSVAVHRPRRGACEA